MKMLVKKGLTSLLLDLFIQDTSSAAGVGLTGLAFGTSGLTCYYHRSGASASTSVTLQTGTVGTWVTGMFKEVDSVNMPGVYQFGIPDAAIASGAEYVSVLFRGAANMAPLTLEIQLVAVDIQDTVRLGLTALPNVASGSAGAIPTTGTGANQISLSSGQTILQSGTGTGQLDFTSGVVKSNLVQILGTVLTETAGQIAAAFKKFFNIATPASTMDALTLVTTATNLTNAPTSGDLTAAMKASVTAAVPTSAQIVTALWTDLLASSDFSTASSIGKLLKDNIDAAISSRSTLGGTAQTGDSYARIGAAGAGLTALGDARLANLDAALSTRATPAQVSTQVLTTALTESYAADGAAPTLAQGIFMIWSMLAEKSIAATTLTCKKLDGTTQSMTFTLSDATNPVSITRAT